MLKKKEAIELLQSKLQDIDLFAFKDPRTSILLPFWQEVFKQLQFNISYLIAVRNPISVVESLYIRDGFEREKSFLFWTKYTLESLKYTKGNQCVFIDYDRLLDNPAIQLERITKALYL